MTEKDQPGDTSGEGGDHAVVNAVPKTADTPNPKVMGGTANDESSTDAMAAAVYSVATSAAAAAVAAAAAAASKPAAAPTIVHQPATSISTVRKDPPVVHQITAKTADIDTFEKAVAPIHVPASKPETKTAEPAAVTQLKSPPPISAPKTPSNPPKTTSQVKSPKTSSSVKSTPSKTSPSKSVYNTDNPLIDPKVVPAVHSIIHLLQTYGPLSYEQLKYNMVPQLVPATSSYSSSQPTTLPPPKLGELADQLDKQQMEKEQQQEGGESNEKKKRVRDKLQKVLDILYELGIIHLIDKRKVKEVEESEKAKQGTGKGSGSKGGRPKSAKTLAKEAAAAKEAADTEGEASKGNTQSAEELSKAINEAEEDSNPIYCFGNGIPRMDVVLPSQILTEIKTAGQEVLRTQQRIEMLKKTLLAVDENKLAVAAALEESKREAEAAAAAAGGVLGTAPLSTAGKEADTTIADKPTPKRSKRKPTPNQMANTVLKQIYQQHPEIVNDPVYASALKMFRINVGSNINHHHISIENSQEVDLITQKVLLDGENKLGRSGGGATGGGERGRDISGKFSRKRSASSAELKRSASGEGGSGSKKRRKKGRTSKGNSSDKLKGGSSSGSLGKDAPALRANASWA